MLIKDGHQIFLLRWVNALRPYYGGDEVAKVVMRGITTGLKSSA